MKTGHHFWLLAVLALGCSGSSDGNTTCGSGTACGGDITGHWTISSSCVSATASSSDMSDCPTGTVSSSGLTVSGTATYNADKTYTEVKSASGVLVVTLPASCLIRNGVTPTCAQVTDGLMQKATDPSYPYSAATCQPAGDGCSCSLTLKSTPTTETGTYTTNGGVLSQQPSGGSAATTNYCVSGTTLSLSPSASTGINGTITLTKQ